MSVSPAAKNQPIDIQIRKYKDKLVTGGFALIIFGIWTIIKSILEAFTVLQPMLGSLISYDDLTEVQIEQVKEMLADNSLFYILLILAIVVLATDLVVRIYVGLSARAVGLQKKENNGIAWFILGIILVAIGVYSLVVTLQNLNDTLIMHSLMYFVVSLFVDVTSLFVTIELMVSGIKVRGLTKKQKEIEEVRDAA